MADPEHRAEGSAPQGHCVKRMLTGGRTGSPLAPSLQALQPVGTSQFPLERTPVASDFVDLTPLPNLAFPRITNFANFSRLDPSGLPFAKN